MAEQAGHGRRVAEQRLREPAWVELRPGLEPAQVGEGRGHAERAGGVAEHPHRLAGVGVAGKRKQGAEGGPRPNPGAQGRRHVEVGTEGPLRLDADVLPEE